MDNMAIGISTTLVGMATVFAVLCLLAVIVSVFKYVAGDKEVAQPLAKPVTSQPEPETLSVSRETHVEDSELAAVIAAVIAASLNTQADKLIVRSFRKVSSWNEIAKRENMKN